jgi:hypothetical protein
MAKTTYTIAMNDEATAALRGINSELGKLRQDVEAIKSIEALQFLGQAFDQITSVIRGSVAAYAEAEQATLKLNAVLTATGGQSGMTSQQIQDMAKNMQALTGIEDEVTIGAATVMAGFKNIKGDSFKRAMAAAQDLSVVLGRDLQSSVTLVGKALEDPTKSDGLRKAGIILSDTTDEIVAGLMKENKLAEAQAVILEEIEGRYQGVAAAARDSLAGELEALSVNLEDVGESVGQGFAPSIDAAAKAVNGILIAIQQVPAPILAGGTAFAAMAAGIPVAVAGFKQIVTLAKALNLTMSGTGGFIALAVAAAAGLAIAIADAYETAEEKQARIKAEAGDLAQRVANDTSDPAVLRTLNQNLIQTQQHLANLRAEYDKIRKGGAVSTPGERIKLEKRRSQLPTEIAEATAQVEAYKTKINQLSAEETRQAESRRATSNQTNLEREEAARKEYDSLVDRYAKASDVLKLEQDIAAVRNGSGKTTTEKKKSAALEELERQLKDAREKERVDGLSPVAKQIEDERARLAKEKSEREEILRLYQANPNDQATQNVAKDKGVEGIGPTPLQQRIEEERKAQVQLNADRAELQRMMAENPNDPVLQNLAQELGIMDQMTEKAQQVADVVGKISGAFNSVMGALRAVQDLQANQHEAQMAQLEAQINAYEKDYDRQLQLKKDLGESTTQFEQEHAETLAKMQEEKAKKEEEYRKKSFENNKAMQLSQAAINIAVGATQALAQGGTYGIAMAAIVALAGAAEIATISSQQYVPQMANGGVVMPRAGGTLVNVAEARYPEAIIPLKSYFGPSTGNSRSYNINITMAGEVYGSLDSFAQQIKDKLEDLEYRRMS